MTVKKTVVPAVAGTTPSTTKKAPKKSADKLKIEKLEAKIATLQEDLVKKNEPQPAVKEPVVLVIPYLHSKAAGKELLLAIRAWEKNFSELTDIVIVGDMLPELNGVIGHIPHRAESDNPQVDVASKLAAVVASGLVPDRFILSNDDIFPVAPIGMEDLLTKKITGPLREKGKESTTYRENSIRTIAALKAEGITQPKDYATHLPVVLEKEKLAEVLAHYQCLKNGHMISTLYFNHHFPDARPIVVQNDIRGSIMISVWKPNPDPAALRKVMHDRQFVNVNNFGWPHVEPYLVKFFPKKSAFEK